MLLPKLSNEWWFASKVCGDQQLCTLFYGITDLNIRKSRVRKAVLEKNMQAERVANSKTTFAQAFERLYGEPLAGKKS